MTDEKIHGIQRIAAFMGVSESTLKRWRKRPEGAFLKIGSMSNIGGGPGRAVWTYASSANALVEAMAIQTSAARCRAAYKRWNTIRVNSGQGF